MSNRTSDLSTASVQPTIGEEMLIYQHLLVTEPQGAETLLAHIKTRLRTEPVTEIDVQTIWHVAPVPDMLDALVGNLVKFDVLNMQPTGGYIHLFIETEMLQMHERGQQQLIAMFEKHQCAYHVPKVSKLKDHLYRPIRGACSRVKHSAEKRAKDLVVRAVLLPHIRKL
ncbi:hypothetical protein GMOD_00000832 [Pyrenophora seminiperda CCB06]|uniref:Uncharacterized protein n=1 Tax=Pyrenophora seminiperda CCB06 TaxID=1302712 RepID=A0A3M7M859_9PLEO|nr:hypothetical protein GMOD_00000832 [Pyrenophora seminiperda CCB06]